MTAELTSEHAATPTTLLTTSRTRSLNDVAAPGPHAPEGTARGGAARIPERRGSAAPLEPCSAPSRLSQA
ncbi:hypothetical protein ACFXKX_33280 [Streptomyces scopuliridis]|uniref:hypothetical protein n=1 Tax=Streptomyces scopuliridis TaxID=452529 RepID=UPI00369CDF8C